MSKFFLLCFVFLATAGVVLALSYAVASLARSLLKRELTQARKGRILGKGKRSPKFLLVLSFCLLAVLPVLSTYFWKSPVSGLVGMIFGFPLLYRWLLRSQYSKHLESVDENSLSFLYALQGLSDVGISLPSALFILAERIDGPFALEFRKSLKKYDDGKSLSELIGLFQKRAGLKLSGTYLNLIERVYSQGLSVTPLLSKMVPLLEMESGASQKIKNLRKASFAQIGMAFCVPWVVVFSLVMFQGDLIFRFLESPKGWLVVGIALLLEGIGARIIWQVSKFY